MTQNYARQQAMQMSKQFPEEGFHVCHDKIQGYYWISETHAAKLAVPRSDILETWKKAKA